MPSITLRAELKQNNLDREYTISVQQGMFNILVVQLFYGKWKASGGTYRKYSFDNKEEAKKFIKNKLTKRLNSYNRIKCSYQIMKTSGTPAQLSGWFDVQSSV